MKKAILLTLCWLFIYSVQANAQIGQRWYNYSDYINNNSGASVDTSWEPLWNDSTAVIGYLSGATAVYDTPRSLSMGMSFGPNLSTWNDTGAYGSTIMVGSSDDYVIDSIRVVGSYGRNNAKLLVKDTLRFGFVYGDGSTSTNLITSGVTSPHYGSINFMEMLYDTAANTARQYVPTAPAVYIQDLVLSATDTASYFVRSIALSTPLYVFAGNVASASMSFKSGDASYIPYDTLFYPDGSAKYGEFTPYISAYQSFGSLIFAPYNPADNNNGYFEFSNSGASGWDGGYVPNWAFYTGSGGPSQLQYPIIDFHIKCVTCALNAPITGTYTVCTGSTTPLYHSAHGGTWSSSATGVATIGSSSGIVTGVSAGFTTITYNDSGHVATVSFEVVAGPDPGIITGSSTVCVGATVNLHSSASMGTWYSSSSTIATVNTSGHVHGLVPGVDTISYVVSSGGCSAAATFVITINAAPVAGAISGPDTVCIGNTITLSDTVNGGAWTTGSSTVASVAGGVVTGVGAGTTTIYYTVSDACGSGIANQVLQVIDCSSTGVTNINGSNSGFSVSPNPANQQITVTARGKANIRSVVISNALGQVMFSQTCNTASTKIDVERLPTGVYIIKVNDTNSYKIVKQ